MSQDDAEIEDGGTGTPPNVPSAPTVALEPGTGGGLTLAAIAERAGVSINTVSRALRTPHTVRPHLRQRINALLEEANYVPNRLAGGLAGSRTDIVGVVVTSLFYSEFAAVIEALQSDLMERGFQVMLANTRYEHDVELRLVRAMLSWRPAALVIVGVDHHPRVTELIRTSKTPTVEIWDIGGEPVDSMVGMDHEAIGYLQADHLLTCGARNLGFVGSLRQHDARALKRLKGARRRLDEQAGGVIRQATASVGGHPDLGSRLSRDLLAEYPKIDGIICNSDAVAFGVLRAMRETGRRVPQDVRVIGFGDNEASGCMTPSLTSIRPPRLEIGHHAARMVLDRINGGPSQTARVMAELIVRESTVGTFDSSS